MSRTLKDRPYRVRVGDPKTPRRYENHDHHVWLREKIGEEKVIVQPAQTIHWGKHYVYKQPEISYMKPVYRSWQEAKPCTMDLPNSKSRGWTGRGNKYLSNEERLSKKDCHVEAHYYPNGPSAKEYQRFSNGARRTKVREQLRDVVREFGTWYDDRDIEHPYNTTLDEVWRSQGIDPDSVDVYDDSYYESRGWWW